MSELKKDPRVQPESDVADDELLQKDADEMADKASEEEERYDEDHDIFTK